MQNVSTEKNIEVPKRFMAFLRTFMNVLSILVRIMYNYMLLSIADICHQLKAIHNTTKYAPFVR